MVRADRLETDGSCELLDQGKTISGGVKAKMAQREGDLRRAILTSVILRRPRFDVKTVFSLKCQQPR